MNLVHSTGTKKLETVEKEILEYKQDLLLLGIDNEGSRETGLFHRIREQLENLSVIIFTPLDEPGASATLRAFKKVTVKH